jgi:flavin reductase (DIM6/NTAB) family NADH-FMN oxidoreductase RutF
MPVSIDEFRHVMSRWTSGITVVTAAFEGQTHGMVASSFASVSADPVSVLFCADHGTRTYPLVKQSGAFAVNILSQEQEEVFRVFAGQKGDRDVDKFAGSDVATAVTGSPILKQCLGWFDCRVIAAYPGGNTHTIFVGEVIAADLGTGADQPPLVYFHRAVRRLAAAEE